MLTNLTSSEKEKLAHYHEMFEGVYKTVSIFENGMKREITWLINMFSLKIA